MSEKYPDRFDQATHGLVLKTYQGDGWLFEGGLPIVRRPAGMIAIEGRTGATFTFTIEMDKNGKETGRILQARAGQSPVEFKVIPYNRPTRL